LFHVFYQLLVDVAKILASIEELAEHQNELGKTRTGRKTPDELNFYFFNDSPGNHNCHTGSGYSRLLCIPAEWLKAEIQRRRKTTIDETFGPIFLKRHMLNDTAPDKRSDKA
jgi:hypothetical protein